MVEWEGGETRNDMYKKSKLVMKELGVVGVGDLN